MRAEEATASLPASRDSFETLEGFLPEARDTAAEFNRQKAYQDALDGLDRYTRLKASLLADIALTAQDILKTNFQGEREWWYHSAMRRFNYLRFASFREGLKTYLELLQGHI